MATAKRFQETTNLWRLTANFLLSCRSINFERPLKKFNRPFWFPKTPFIRQTLSQLHISILEFCLSWIWSVYSTTMLKIFHAKTCFHKFIVFRRNSTFLLKNVAHLWNDFVFHFYTRWQKRVLASKKPFVKV